VISCTSAQCGQRGFAEIVAPAGVSWPEWHGWE
jgi:hypothetical protein